MSFLKEIKKIKESIFGKWQEFRRFDMIEAEEQFEKYKFDLKLGELVVLGDESICKVYVENGKYVSSIRYTDREVNGVEKTNWGFPCLHFIYMNGDEEYIPCYDIVYVNSKTGEERYKGRVRLRVLTVSEVDAIMNQGEERRKKLLELGGKNYEI